MKMEDGDFLEKFYAGARKAADAGQVKWLDLPESTRKAINQECRKEADIYPNLRWEFDDGFYDKKDRLGKNLSFNYPPIHYKRLDPLPEDRELPELRELEELQSTRIEQLEKELDTAKQQLETVTQESLDIQSRSIYLNTELEKAKVEQERLQAMFDVTESRLAECSKENELLRDIRRLAMINVL